MQLVSKISNLCGRGPDPPTSKTDRQTDGQTTCNLNTALCTKVHRAVKMQLLEHNNWDNMEWDTKWVKIVEMKNKRCRIERSWSFTFDRWSRAGCTGWMRVSETLYLDAGDVGNLARSQNTVSRPNSNSAAGCALWCDRYITDTSMMDAPFLMYRPISERICTHPLPTLFIPYRLVYTVGRRRLHWLGPSE